MATNPDDHPDSMPGGPSEAPAQVAPFGGKRGRERVEDTPGTDGGTSGTGGTNHRSDRDITS